nr:MAG TPA: hypothetical protein [Microviridae sp.]
MPCYHPLLGLPKGVRPDTGKMQYLIKPWPKGVQYAMLSSVAWPS